MHPGKLIILLLMILPVTLFAQSQTVIRQSVTYTSPRVQTYTTNVTRTQTSLLSTDSVYLIGFHSGSCYYIQVDLGSGLAGTRLTGTINTQGDSVTLFILNSRQWSPIPVASRMCGDFFPGQYIVKGLSEEGRPYELDWVFPDNDHYWFVIFDSYNDSQVNYYLNAVKAAPVGTVTYSTSYVLLISAVSGSTISSTQNSLIGNSASEPTRNMIFLAAITVMVAVAVIALFVYARRRQP